VRHGEVICNNMLRHGEMFQVFIRLAAIDVNFTLPSCTLICSRCQFAKKEKVLRYCFHW